MVSKAEVADIDRPWPDSPWLTRRQAAKYLHVTFDTMQNWGSRGEGPPYSRPHPQMVRYHLDDLDAWLRAHMHADSRTPIDAA